ncbi:MAG: hypothetical protein WAW36_11675 [Methylovulum miyakonense]|uniref:hypothetical protein n=1 Tax=Methylovulum miyakonense TaxID=645578 RepID=UPI003BB7EEE8
MTTPAQYITNENGDKISVILPLAEYHALLEALEDLEDLALVKEREHEADIPLAEVVENLKRHGKI